MDDALELSAHRRFPEQQRRLADEAWLAHAADPARECAVPVLASWLVGAIAVLPASIPAHGLGQVAAPVTIGARLRDLSLHALATPLEAFLASDIGEARPEVLQAGMAFGEALAHAVAHRPEEPMMRLAHWLLGLHDTLPRPYV